MVIGFFFIGREYRIELRDLGDNLKLTVEQKLEIEARTKPTHPNLLPPRLAVHFHAFLTLFGQVFAPAKDLHREIRALFRL